MGLIEALRANAEYLADGQRMPYQPGKETTLVIADSNPALTGVLDDALGLLPGQAVVVQVAGAWGGREGQELLRSVAMGLHVHGCKEILVIGSDAASDVPDRRKLREIINERGLDPDGEQADLLFALARGPSNPQDGVRDTVRLLRASALVPQGTPVHGCLLQAASGLLKVIDQDPAMASGSGPRTQEPADGLIDVPLPDLPDIPRPEIPGLDLDDLTAPLPPPTPKRKKKKKKPTADYGAEGSGPVSMADIQKMPDAQAMATQANAETGWQPIPTVSSTDELRMSVAAVEFQIPETSAIQDTGMGDAQDMRPGQPEIDQEWFDHGLEPRQDVRARPDVGLVDAPQPPPRRPKPKPAPVRKPERPEVTPIVRQAQSPIGEQVLEFDDATPPPPKAKPKQKKSRGPQVDIKAGYVAKDGAEFPLDPELQRALLKVGRFLASEFAAVDRNQIMGRIRQAARQNQQTGELLKLMIGPVLKLGKKRYAVINELLKIKEELPRQAPDVAVVLLEEILTGS